MGFIFVKSNIYTYSDLDYRKLLTYNIAQLTVLGEAK
jgi:hypothetical protein